MIEVVRLDSKTWVERFSEYAHKAVFEEEKRSELDRIDFALLALKNDIPVGYITCREIDRDTVYWQYGGVIKKERNSITSYRIYEAMLLHCFSHYQRVLKYIENTNKPMLKFAMKMDFKIIGTRNYKGSVLLEHLKELDGNK